MEKTELEKRIIELEIRSASQDETIGELNQAVISLQKKVDRFEKQIKRLEEQAASGDLVKKLEDEEPPPHY